MREEHGALIGRAAAAVGVSVALHLALIALSASVLVGALLIDTTEEPAPLVIDVIASDVPSAARPTGQSPRGQASPAGRRASAEARPSSAPPAPAPGPADEEVATEPPAAGDPRVAVVDDPSVGDAASRAASSGEAARAAVAGSAASDDPGTDQAVNDGQPGAATASTAEPDAAGGGAAEGDAARTRAAVAEPAVIADPRVNLSRLGEVARNPSVSARAEGQPFVGRREVFEFLLDHPDFATHVTRALRLARYRMWRAGDELFVDDGWGATGRVFVVYATSGTRVLYARGEFQSGLFPAIPGEAVVTITYDARPAVDGRELLSANISSQVKIGGVLGELVVKVASSLATEKAERESRRLVRTFAQVLRAVDEKPAALYASLLGRPDVPQRELEQFRVLLKLP